MVYLFDESTRGRCMCWCHEVINRAPEHPVCVSSCAFCGSDKPAEPALVSSEHGWEEAIGKIGSLEVSGSHLNKAGWSVRVIIGWQYIGTSGQWRGEVWENYDAALSLALTRAVERIPGVEFER